MYKRQQVNGRVKEQSKVRLLVIMAMLVAVCGICAQVSIPMPIGVPFTLDVYKRQPHGARGLKRALTLPSVIEFFTVAPRMGRVD